MDITSVEHEIQEFYENLWSEPTRIHRTDENVILGWHFGFYNEETQTIHDAMHNMNFYLEKLLELPHDAATILDCGSGIGYTSIYLAKKYPHCMFHGITLTSNELNIAQNLQRKNKVKNVFFRQASYMHSDFDDDFFDRIFALESVIYAPNKKKFLLEIYRLLKPEGKMIIIDMFSKRFLQNNVSLNVDNYFHLRSFTPEEFNLFYVNVSSFISLIKALDFYDIQVSDLAKQGNVKKTHLYGFLIYRLFIAIPIQLRKIKTKKNMNKISYWIKYPFMYSILLVYFLLMILYNKPSYYSLQFRKKLQHS